MNWSRNAFVLLMWCIAVISVLIEIHSIGGNDALPKFLSFSSVAVYFAFIHRPRKVDDQPATK